MQRNGKCRLSLVTWGWGGLAAGLLSMGLMGHSLAAQPVSQWGTGERNVDLLWVDHPFDYVVQPGDNLFRIALKYNLKLEVLADFNRIDNPAHIRAGERLWIPTHLSGPVGRQEHPALSSRDRVQRNVDTSRMRKLGQFTLTAYTAGPESTGKRPGDPGYGITASGARVEEGVTIAVDPAVIPMGATVYIEGIGFRVAQDKGSAIKGNRIDLYMESLEEALAFGRQSGYTVYLVME